MIWIYIPPVIFVIALAVLVVVFGKKVARAKRQEASLAPKREFQPSSFQKRGGIQTGHKLLRALERTLLFFKFIIKKTEEALAEWLMKLRSKRSKKQYPEIMDENSARESIILRENIIKKIETTESGSPNSEVRTKSFGEERKTVKTVIGRPLESKITEQPVFQPEDKVKEDALIHRIAENPKDVEAYRELGDYYFSTGNIKDAKDSFKVVLKLRPRDLKAKSSLREIEIRMRLGS